MNFNLVLILFFCGCFKYSSGQIATYVLELHDLLKMQQGIGWPPSLFVAEGNEALIKLSRSLINQRSCTVVTPDGQEYNVNSLPSNRFERWSDGCGVRLRHVVKTDEGRWRLNATNVSGSIAGWTELHIKEAIPSYTAPPIALQDGQTHTDVVLTTLDSSYCLVAQPFSESSLVPGQCHVNLDRTTRAVQGNWNVLLGIPGRVQELHMQREVAVEAERLDVGYVFVADTNKLHLYCNILHTAKNVTFCRFQKTSSTSGYNVMDGLSDGSHSYYGDGFLARECGMTIETPTAADYGTWRCSVGTQNWVDNQIQKSTPLQALISVTSPAKMRRAISDGSNQTVFVQEDHTFTIMCRGDVSLQYCRFQHPNGSQFTPVPVTSEEQLFWYSGESLQVGDCGISFSHATLEDAGVWACHMGSRQQLGMEITDTAIVRVTGPLAANKKELTATIGEILTLYCHTSNGKKPLDYCRFLAPNMVGLNIDSTITEENAILGRFYFTPGRDLNYGDCSLTIKDVTDIDIGEWTCAALINEDSTESRDSISVYVEVIHQRNRASIAGMVVGLSVLVMAGLGFAWHKSGYRFLRWPRRVTNGMTELYVAAMARPSDSSEEVTIERRVQT